MDITYEIRAVLSGANEVSFYIYEDGVRVQGYSFWGTLDGTERDPDHTIAGAYQRTQQFVERRKRLAEIVRAVMEDEATE